MAEHTNRLAHETSPYLLQHAHNPVDWYPWGPEALNRARAQDKPIFLSIGYAACHWCHVMERESFENGRTAAFLNDRFVAIKVDREERPDLDAIYMDAVQHMTGGGGWPMSVFLTPQGKPFYGGTYFPDQPRHGLPSFTQVLAGVDQAWRERRGDVEESAGSLASAVSAQMAPTHGTAEIDPKTLDAAVLDTVRLGLERDFDARHGGWGGAPKFPQPMTIEFLLRRQALDGDQRSLAMARRTLDGMAAGGIYDHLGGGFARYATDAVWLVPHFEKMLYDNAQLARVYTHAWQLTHEPRYAAVVEETIGFVLRELRTADGGFASSLDADTDGEEGATYTWTKTEIDDVLGDEAAEFDAAYGVTPNGNWEGRTILARPIGAADSERLAIARGRLFEARQRRPQPARDGKVLTAWNGLMIGALADAAAAFGRSDWADAAAAAADLLLSKARNQDGHLFRSWKDGRAKHAGVLEDYADLADGLLALYEATFDERWFGAACQLADTILAHFADPAGGFFDTADDHEALIARPKGLQDNAVPSGGAMAVTVLLKLAALTGERRYEDAASTAIAKVASIAERYPTAFAQWLSAATFSLSDPVEICVSRDPAAGDGAELMAVIRTAYRPFAVIAAGESASSAVPLLQDRPMRDGHATAYVCRHFACRAPVTDAAALAEQLAAA